MSRPLAQILSEISASYNPQRTILNQQIGTLDPQMQSEQQGLDAAKTDAFSQITDQSNRRGLLFSGIPIDEQAKYTGASYLPAVANLHAKYAQQRFNLQNALAGLDTEAQKTAYGVYGNELSADAARSADAAANPSFDFGSLLGTPQATPAVLGAQASLRQVWQKEAAGGDWQAQVALNYAGNDGKYDGPVNSQSELNILKKMGITGNYYLRPAPARSPYVPTNTPGARQVGGPHGGGLWVR